jgi:hypothetical protein
MNARTTTEADIWQHLIHPDGRISRETAKRILEIDFSPEQRELMHRLAEKNQRGDLSDDEEAELDHYCRVSSMLSILKLRSQKVLNPKSSR